tara:strand:- start:19 stop:318 length:300 start_codon:yes stop_codon:yes gene_type:complete
MGRYENTTRSKKVLSSISHNRAGNVTKYNTTIYQENEKRNSDVFIITQHGDRLDLLADQFYEDPTLWWFIARANNIKTMNLKAGLSLRIPVSIEDAQGE